MSLSTYSILILDDETIARKQLKKLLNIYCSQAGPVFCAANIEQARLALSHQKIDLLFLDIDLGSENGFDLLEKTYTRNQAVIFVTAYEAYGFKAIKAGAVDYLLKPVVIDELVAAVEKADAFLSGKKSPAHLPGELPAGLLPNEKTGEKVVIVNGNDFEIVVMQQIIFAAAEGNYTYFHLEGNRKLLSTRPLGAYEALLPFPGFFRAHKSYLINMKQLKRFSSQDGHTAFLSGGYSIPVSRRKVAAFLELCKSIHAW